MNYTFEIVSRRYGTFVVTAPLRFRHAISAYSWHVHRDKSRAEGRQFVVDATASRSEGKRTIRLHRLIWELAGNRPALQIDHRDGDSLNNSEENLRDAGRCGNQRNRGKRRTNSSGVVGVSRSKGKSRWEAYIRDGNRQRRLGSFKNIEDAKAAREKAVKELHGEFGVY